jgi:hypothetical protein
VAVGELGAVPVAGGVGLVGVALGAGGPVALALAVGEKGGAVFAVEVGDDSPPTLPPPLLQPETKTPSPTTPSCTSSSLRFTLCILISSSRFAVRCFWRGWAAGIIPLPSGFRCL